MSEHYPHSTANHLLCALRGALRAACKLELDMITAETHERTPTAPKDPLCSCALLSTATLPVDRLIVNGSSRSMYQKKAICFDDASQAGYGRKPDALNQLRAKSSGAFGHNQVGVDEVTAGAENP